MSTKEIAIQTIKSLPDNATWEDIQERINFVAGVREGTWDKMSFGKESYENEVTTLKGRKDPYHRFH